MKDQQGTGQVPTPLNEVRRRIEVIRSSRGYIMPSHAVLAISAPDLLETYETVYRQITGAQGKLPAFDKYFIWLVVVACTEVPVGAHHVTEFLHAGGTIRQIETIVALGSIVTGSHLQGVIGPGWKAAVPEFDMATAYDRAVELITSSEPLPVGLAEIALATGHSCRQDWEKVGLHIRRAKQAGVSDDALAEALSIAILPAGNPVFARACAIWCGLIREGIVAASPRLEKSLASQGAATPDHHAVLAATAPEFLAAYGNLERSLTAPQRILSRFEKKLVAFFVAASLGFPVDAAEQRDFIDAGATEMQVEAVLAMAMVIAGSSVIDGAASTGEAARVTKAYHSTLERIASGAGFSPALAEAASAAAQSSRRNWNSVVAHICRALEAGIDDDALAESLTSVIVPSGNPNFVQSATVWRDLIRQGKVKTSEAYHYAAHL